MGKITRHPDVFITEGCILLGDNPLWVFHVPASLVKGTHACLYSELFF